jgi:CRP-like cAMP-binding protein
MTTECIEVLRNQPFLEGARPEVLERLARAAQEKHFGPGEVIIEEGSTGRSMYLVVDGQVEIVRRQGDGELQIAKRGAGDLFGEMGALEARPRSATVRALEPTRLFRFRERSTHAALSTQPLLLYKFVQMLSARLRESDRLMIETLQRQIDELTAAGDQSD